MCLIGPYINLPPVGRRALQLAARLSMRSTGKVVMEMETRALAGRARENVAFSPALAAVSEGRLVPVPGGALIRNANENSAVGVSGDRSATDEACAVAGIRKLGFLTDPGDDQA